MPTAVGPNTKGEENLIFGFDLKDTRNSYKGEPTENLITNPRPTSTTGFSRSGGTGAITYDSEKQAVYWEQTAYATWGAYINFFPAFTGTLDTNSQYTFSLEYYSESEFAETGINYNLVQGNGQSGATYYNNITPKVVEIGGGWKRFTHTFLPANSGVSAAYNRFIVGNKGTNVLRLWFRNIQFEKKSKRTPFTAGTRSATQGLVDLTGNSTIDLSNVSFNSKAVPDWDGTSDYIKSTTPSDFRMGTSSFTLEAVAKQDVNTGHVLLEARGNNLIGYLWVVNHGTTGRMSFFYNDDSNQNIHYQTGDFNVSLTGVYYHLAVKVDRNENNIYFYINGEQAGNAVALQHTNSISPSSSDYYHVGWDRGGSPWNGQIAMFKHYNRALTASEIKANYNAVKGRFNI